MVGMNILMELLLFYELHELHIFSFVRVRVRVFAFASCPLFSESLGFLTLLIVRYSK
jgi:hypothetical protein